MGNSRQRNQATWLTALHNQMQRPGQAPIGSPYWIVLNLSVHKVLHFRPPFHAFRHPTFEGAVAEAERLAADPQTIGRRFAVFEFTGVTAKVERPVPEIEAKKNEEAPVAT